MSSIIYTHQPQAEKLQSLTQYLVKSEIFNLQAARVLSFVIANPQCSALMIIESLKIPDSKVYPALKKLQKEDLIIQDKTERPSKYYISDPQFIKDIINKKIQDKITLIKSISDNISFLIDTLWEPEPNRELGQIAYIFRGRKLFSEVLRFLKQVETKLVMFISPSFKEYLGVLQVEIPKILDKNIRIELALPKEIPLIDIIPKHQCENHQLFLKESTVIANSYFVADNKFMLKVTHNIKGDVALLTNDDLLVSFLDDCWNSNECCVNSELISPSCC